MQIVYKYFEVRTVKIYPEIREMPKCQFPHWAFWGNLVSRYGCRFLDSLLGVCCTAPQASARRGKKKRCFSRTAFSRQQTARAAYRRKQASCRFEEKIVAVLKNIDWDRKENFSERLRSLLCAMTLRRGYHHTTLRGFHPRKISGPPPTAKPRSYISNVAKIWNDPKMDSVVLYPQPLMMADFQNGWIWWPSCAAVDFTAGVIS